MPVAKFPRGLGIGDEYLLEELWMGTLENWSQVLHFAYDIISCDVGKKTKSFGEWFRYEGVWCIQLEGSRVAQIHMDECDESLRRALSWTLGTISSMHSVVGGQELCNALVNLSAAKSEKLLHALHHPKVVQSLPNTMMHEPGYLLWIRFEYPNNHSGSCLEQTTELVDEVIQAISPSVWYVWFTYKSKNDSILLYQPIISVAHLIDEHISGDMDNSEVKFDLELESIRFYAQSLTVMLESDAMVAPTTFVSQKIEHPGEVYCALATLVITDRTESQCPNAERISVFADKRLQHWISLLPDALQELFIEWTNPVLRNEDSNLPKEMEDVLEGLVSANLNVSEAARNLYLHRNTLVNRIERIKRITGFDIRNFFDAAMLWMALKMQ